MGQDAGLKFLAHETGAKCKDEDSDRFAEGAVLQLGVICWECLFLSCF